MRAIMVVAAVVCAAACGSDNIVGRNTGPSNARSPRSEASPAPSANNNSAPPATAERRGEKVDAPIDYNFLNGIPAGWERIDPETANPSVFDTSGGALKLEIPTGKDLYGGNRTAPRLVKNVTGDFEIETLVKIQPTENYQGAGLFIFRNDNHFVRLERGFGGVGADGDGVRFDRAEDEFYDAVATPEKFPVKRPNVELKLRREGRVITAYWREPGAIDWIEMGKVANNYPETVVVGLIGINTGGRINAEFSWIKLRPLPASASR